MLTSIVISSSGRPVSADVVTRGWGPALSPGFADIGRNVTVDGANLDYLRSQFGKGPQADSPADMATQAPNTRGRYHLQSGVLQ